MSNAKKSSTPRTSGITKVTWAHCVRDVLNKAMSTGQMLPLCIFIIIVMLLWRLPSSEISGVIHDIVTGMTNGSLIGWGLLPCTLVLWAGHARLMRRTFSIEAERIGKEKTDLQQKQTQLPLGTSDQ